MSEEHQMDKKITRNKKELYCMSETKLTYMSSEVKLKPKVDTEINEQKRRTQMNEVKIAGGNAVRAKKRKAWLVAWRFSDGLIVRSATLFESEHDARKCALEMRDFCLNNGDLDGAEMYESAKFAVCPVEFDEPEIDWEVAR